MHTRPPALTPDQERLFHEHVPMVAMLAAVVTRRIRRRGLYDDFYQVGLMGLLHCVRRFDAARGSKKEFFSVRVKGAMYDHLRELDPMERGLRDKLAASGRLPPADISLNHEASAQHASAATAWALDVSDELKWVLQPLTETQRKLLYLYFIEDRTDHEAAALFSKSAMWVFQQMQQIRERVGDRLRMGPERRQLFRKKALPH